MTDPDAVAGHTFGDPDEAREYFTADRMAKARPRRIELDEQGRRIEPPDPDAEPCSGSGSTSSDS